MRILHTSDWHLGRALYGRKRYDEFEAFLDWLAEIIAEHAIDVLLLAGDLFDSTSPSHRAQALYYRFLCRIAASPCRHVVVIAGNHDSPSLLEAPRELLKALDVHVIGSAAQDPQDEVLLLRDAAGAPELIVCAVPYLRDRDIRSAEAGEAQEDKERKLREGIRAHYAAVAAHAERLRQDLHLPPERDIPIVGTGHLFTAGGQTQEGDGVRDLYIGSLAHVPLDSFPACFDYLALGHLHVPQMVAGRETIRYSGSPLPMGFGERSQQKILCRVELNFSADAGRSVQVEVIKVPCFRRLERISGHPEHIQQRLAQLKAEGAACWIEVIYDAEELIGNLREALDAAVADSGLEILRIKNNRLSNRVLAAIHDQEDLADLDENAVFQRCLDSHQIAAEQQPLLMQAYQEILRGLHEADERAE
jgi:exonuclease SbcD